jgi:RHS repeat-associated protein
VVAHLSAEQDEYEETGAGSEAVVRNQAFASGNDKQPKHRTYLSASWVVVSVTGIVVALCVAASATNPVTNALHSPVTASQTAPIQTPPDMDPNLIVNNITHSGVQNQSVEVARRAAAGIDEPDPTAQMTRSMGLHPEKIKAGNQIAQGKQLAQGGANNSQFVYDPFGRCVKIIETRSGSVTSTKQFIWNGDTLCEERDGTGAVTKQFFKYGQTLSGSNYYYTRDQIDSVREMTDGSGNTVAAYSYDPYGRTTKLQGSLDSDIQYGGYYHHGPSGLSLAVHRAYSPTFGRWLNRDPIEDFALGPLLASALQANQLASVGPTELLTGPNLYSYVSNRPVMWRDPSGLVPPRPTVCPTFDCKEHPVLCECRDQCGDPAVLKQNLGSFQWCFAQCIKKKEPAQGPYVPRPPKMEWPFNEWQQQVPPEVQPM